MAGAVLIDRSACFVLDSQHQARTWQRFLQRPRGRALIAKHTMQDFTPSMNMPGDSLRINHRAVKGGERKETRSRDARSELDLSAVVKISSLVSKRRISP